MQLPAANVLPFLVLVPLIVWRLYSRIRRNIGRQPLSNVRPYITIGLFPLLVVLLGWGALRRPELVAALLSALAGGIAGGVVLGIYGLRHTKFEVTPQGRFYTPNAHIGIALSLLFVGRVIYRMMVLYSQNPYAAQTPQDFSSSPLTLGIFGLLAGYYVTYAIGLVRWRQRVSDRETVPPSTGS
ncbi:MAG TPA: hypothetical protein VFP37_02765 [Steroidobacteraceae bacterium]|nr:hypothetical protein [Steroidobacteraceae bacterium]